MDPLTNIWSNYTAEFNKVQKVIIAIVLALIICIAMLAVVLMILEITQ